MKCSWIADYRRLRLCLRVRDETLALADAVDYKIDELQ